MTKHILVIEDEKPLAQALKLKLTHSGFEVKNAFNGAEGLNLLNEESFDMILTDLVMPNGDGFSVIEEIANRGIKTPIIVLSNLSQAGDIEKVKQFGITDFFIKSDTPIADIVTHIKKKLEA